VTLEGETNHNGVHAPENLRKEEKKDYWRRGLKGKKKRAVSSLRVGGRGGGYEEGTGIKNVAIHIRQGTIATFHFIGKPTEKRAVKSSRSSLSKGRIGRDLNSERFREFLNPVEARRKEALCNL